jgi:hypothetical protein
MQPNGDDHRADVPLFPLIPERPAADKTYGACFGHRSAAAVAQMRVPRRSLASCSYSRYSSGVRIRSPLTDNVIVLYRLLDTTHSSLMIASTWDYFVLNFGNEEVVDKIPM